jgi:glucan endo-1,3-beta-D-glucosidase
MALLSALLLAAQILTFASAAVHTGYNVGAFWGDPWNCKKKADYLDMFNYAKTIQTPVPLDTARLFTSVQCNTQNNPIEAFDAAVETGTKLLLGFYLSAPKNATPGQPTNAEQNAAQLQHELDALKKGFEKHGQKLADLVIGLSVGNEDIFNWENKNSAVGASTETIQANFDKVRDTFNGAPLSDLMETSRLVTRKPRNIPAESKELISSA